VESSLLDALPDHLNAEIVAGSLKTKQDVVDYITWTYFFRRLLQNPSYYGLDDTSDDALNKCELICIEGSLAYKFSHLTLILYYNNAGFLRPL
jgi:activating signal cointegrator complex subunit 3